MPDTKRSKAAKLGHARRWKRRKQEIRDGAKPVTNREKAFFRRRQAALKGHANRWKRRREALRQGAEPITKRERQFVKRSPVARKARKKVEKLAPPVPIEEPKPELSREEKIRAEIILPSTPQEKMDKVFYDVEPDVEDRRDPLIFTNPDNSVDGELTLMIDPDFARDYLRTIENRMGVLPPGIWFSIGLHFTMKGERDSPPIKGAFRPEGPLNPDLELGGGSVYSNYRDHRDQAVAFLFADDVLLDIENSEKTGSLFAVSVRLAWNHGHRPD